MNDFLRDTENICAKLLMDHMHDRDVLNVVKSNFLSYYRMIVGKRFLSAYRYLNVKINILITNKFDRTPIWVVGIKLSRAL